MRELIPSAMQGIFQVLTKGEFSNTGIKKYLTNLTWLSIGRLALMATSFATLIVAARILGPESYGILNYVLSFVGLYGIIANLGIDGVVFRELTSRKEARNLILNNALALRFSTGCFAVISVLITLLFIKEDPHTEFLMFLFSLSFLTQTFSLLSFDFLKDAQGKYVTIAQVCTSILSNALKIAVLFFYNSLTLYILVLVLEGLLLGVFYLYQMKLLKRSGLELKLNKKELVYTLSLSLPLMLVALCTELYARIDQIMLKHLLDIQAVGYYAAAVRITELWYFIPTLILGSLFPAFINTQHNTSEYDKRMRMMIMSLIVVGSILSIVIYFSSSILIKIIYGDGFSASVPILSIYILSLVGSFLSFLFYQDLFIKNKIFLIIIISSAGAVANILLNLMWIPAYGAAGAAWSTVLSYSMLPLIYFILRKYERL
jgi:O-antigen/teichoic acid export membrane protein